MQMMPSRPRMGDPYTHMLMLYLGPLCRRPCKAFMPTYHQLAERFSDFVMLEITGDETPELRQVMKDWKVSNKEQGEGVRWALEDGQSAADVEPG